MIEQVSANRSALAGRRSPFGRRRSPVIGRRAPLADLLASDDALEAMLKALDIKLVFAWLDLPRKSVGTPSEQLFPDVDTETIERLQRGRAYLVVDHSSEGPRHIDAFSELLHAWCRLRAVPPSALVYVSTNTEHAAHYATWCEAQGISEHERYTYLYYNAYVFEVTQMFAELDRVGTESTLLGREPRPHRFLCFNQAPRPERIFVAAHMLSVDPPDALVSLGSSKGPVSPEGSLRQIAARFERNRLLDQHPALFDDLRFATVQSRTTLPAPDPAEAVSMYQRFDLELYARTYVSVVTESEMTDGHVQRITEKALKPFLFGHLAVVAGNPGALTQVRELGFGTFDPLIDESYDEIADPNERLCAVLCEVDRLRSLPMRELHDLFTASEGVRRANLRYGHDVLPHRLRADAHALVTRHVLDGERVRSQSSQGRS